MECPECGRKNRPSTPICPGCGKSLKGINQKQESSTNNSSGRTSRRSKQLGPWPELRRLGSINEFLAWVTPIGILIYGFGIGIEQHEYFREMNDVLLTCVVILYASIAWFLHKASAQFIWLLLDVYDRVDKERSS